MGHLVITNIYTFRNPSGNAEYSAERSSPQTRVRSRFVQIPRICRHKIRVVRVLVCTYRRVHEISAYFMVFFVKNRRFFTSRRNFDPKFLFVYIKRTHIVAEWLERLFWHARSQV